ncbi:MAG: cytochrome b/b6 domain-containing protein [Methylococcaceae bacterium]|jgi:cytochrome b
MNTNNKNRVKVWDPVVRIGHWLLVAAFFIAYFTEDEFILAHVWAGYVVAAVVAVRLLWGFIGSRHARFVNFVRPPKQIAAYLKTMLAGKPQHYLGHNPAGGAMVIALLISLSATVLSGMQLYAVADNKGPLALASSTQNHPALAAVPFIADAQASNTEEDNDSQHNTNKKEDSAWEALHEVFANFTIVLVAIHIIGVILSSIIDKEKLLKAMLTGTKNSDNTYL